MSTTPVPPNRSLQEIRGPILAQKLAAAPEGVQLIDVREPWEVETAAIAGFINLPLSQFAQWEGRIHELLDPEAETIVLCHHGIRSAQMCYWLMGQGFTQVKNLSGGIDAYTLEVDPAIPRY
jgi:rhodanese-related sulfurtransferase